VRIFAPGAEVGSIAQEHSDAEKPPFGEAALCLSAVLARRYLPLHLYGQGFGEFEAEGGLGGQDDLLVPGVCRSCGSRTGTHCGTNQGSFTTAGKPPDVGEDLESGIMPTGLSDRGRKSFGVQNSICCLKST